MSQLHEIKSNSDELVAQIKKFEEQVAERQASISTLEQKQSELKSDKTGNPVTLAEEMANVDRDISVARHTIDILKSRITELVATVPDTLDQLKAANRAHKQVVNDHNDQARETYLQQPAIKQALIILRDAYSTSNVLNKPLETFLVDIGWNDVTGEVDMLPPGYRSYDYNDYELTRELDLITTGASYNEYRPQKKTKPVNERWHEGPELNRVR